MATRAQALYDRLDTAEAIAALIGSPEDSDFDCKVWRGRADARNGHLAKAACGFANVEGGVIIIGLDARKGSDGVDVVQSLAPVNNTAEVASEAQEVIRDQVEPGIEGLNIRRIPAEGDAESGYVVIYVPGSDDAHPKRSRKDGRFYVRISASTEELPYSLLADRFGRRPHPLLRLRTRLIDPETSLHSREHPIRRLVLSVANDGRTLARFPALRVIKSKDFWPQPLVAGMELPLWPMSSAIDGWYSYRGGADAVLYPGEEIAVGSLIQSGQRDQLETVSGSHIVQRSMKPSGTWRFRSASVGIEVVCEGMMAVRTFIQVNPLAVDLP